MLYFRSVFPIGIKRGGCKTLFTSKNPTAIRTIIMPATVIATVLKMDRMEIFTPEFFTDSTAMDSVPLLESPEKFHRYLRRRRIPQSPCSQWIDCFQFPVFAVGWRES